MNNDTRAEIIDVGGFAGSACDLEPKVWSWKAKKIVDLSPDHLELELGCSLDDRVILQDIDNDNLKEMILAGQTVGHLDYANPRGITQTFTLKDTGYTLVNTVFAPTDLRVHVLDDAQRDLDNGDLNSALDNYTYAAYDDNLKNTYSYTFGFDLSIAEELDFPEEYQRAFALFRLATIQLTLGKTKDADTALAKLIARYPENKKGHEFVVLTEIFFDSFNDEKNLEEACNKITEFITENYENLAENPGLTSHFYWGSNIASYYTAESFCPIFTIPTENEP